MPRTAATTDITLTELEAVTILETVTAAYNFLWVHDMGEAYLKLNRQNRQSPLTLALESVVTLLQERIDPDDESVQQN